MSSNHLHLFKTAEKYLFAMPFSCLTLTFQIVSFYTFLCFSALANTLFSHFFAMPRKPRALSSAFNTAKPLNETSNEIQSPWFPFTYAASANTSNSSPAVKVSASSNYNVASQDATASLALSNKGWLSQFLARLYSYHILAIKKNLRYFSAGQSSASVSPCNDDSLRPNVSAQKRKSPDVLQLRGYNEACAARNVKPKFGHPALNLAAATSVSQPQINTPTYDQHLSIDAHFQQTKQRQQKRKRPVVEQQCAQAQPASDRNIRHCLESAGVHGIQSRFLSCVMLTFYVLNNDTDSFADSLMFM